MNQDQTVSNLVELIRLHSLKHDAAIPKFRTGDLVITKRKDVYHINSSFIKNNKIYYKAYRCGCDFGTGTDLLENNIKKVGVAIH